MPPAPDHPWRRYGRHINGKLSRRSLQWHRLIGSVAEFIAFAKNMEKSKEQSVIHSALFWPRVGAQVALQRCLILRTSAISLPYTLILPSQRDISTLQIRGHFNFALTAICHLLAQSSRVPFRKVKMSPSKDNKMDKLLQMSDKEITRLEAMRRIKDKTLTQKEAARMLN